MFDDFLGTVRGGQFPFPIGSSCDILPRCILSFFSDMRPNEGEHET